MAKTILTRTREAIYNEFQDWIPGKNKAEKMKEIRSATYTGKGDPGGWSPGAAVVIHTESGIPTPTFDETPGFQIIEGWFRVSDELETHYCETVNAAVISVWEV
jgi:hypothetical protein